MVRKNCVVCGKEFSVIPARAETASLCSNACRYVHQKTARLGDLNGRWKGGSREKECQHCGKVFQWAGQPYASWVPRKFCSVACRVAGQKRLYGELHPNFNPQASKRSRGNFVKLQGEWSARVRVRDDFTCQSCGKRGGDLHAHHIKPWSTAPESRFDVGNGITLCVKCHHAAHSANGKLGEFGGTPNVKSRAIPSEAADGTP